MKVNLMYLIFLSIIFIEKISAAGFSQKNEQFHMDSVIRDPKESKKLDNVFFENSAKTVESHHSNENIMPPILKKIKPNVLNDQETKVSTPRQTIDRGKIRVEDGRKIFNSKTDLMANLTVEYVSGGENETWNLEKTMKVSDTGSENEKCKMTTEELIATAQQTVIDTLNGLCSASEMEKRFDDLENSLTSQLSTIKNLLIGIEKKLEPSRDDTLTLSQKSVGSTGTKDCSGTTITSFYPEIKSKGQKSGSDNVKPFSSTPENAGFEEDEEVGSAGVRDAEVLKFNSSIHMETGSSSSKKVFTYYWKIKNMTYKLAGFNPRKSFRSQSFYIFPSGYRMYMRVFPRQNEDTLYVRVGLTKGEFDDSLRWPFSLKHKIHILDQTTQGRVFEDIASKIWDPNLLCSDFNWEKPVKADNQECVEVAFPHDVLRQREYIIRDTLIIKLTVYLEI